MDKLRLSFHQIPTINSSGKGNTPEKYKLGSQHRNTSRKYLFSNNSGSNKSYDTDDVMLLEIKLLKRQNAFLKKKIDDLNRQKKQLLQEGFGIALPRKIPYPKKGAPKDNRDTLQISAEYFFKQINNLIKSVGDAFHLHLTQIDKIQYEKLAQTIKSYPPMNSPVLKKQYIHRKLQKIILEVQSNRYPLLLDLFADYYRIKSEADKQTMLYVDSLTQKTIDLNRWMLQKINQSNKNKKLKSQQGCNEPYKEQQFIFSGQIPQNPVSEKNINRFVRDKHCNLKLAKSKH